jgi:hypothetical protein
MATLDFTALSELLYDIIPQFTDLAHCLYEETSDRFYMEFETVLTFLRTGCNRRETCTSQLSLMAIARLLEDLVHDSVSISSQLNQYT